MHTSDFGRSIFELSSTTGRSVLIISEKTWTCLTHVLSDADGAIRNPPSARRSYEKNWVIFSTSPASSYIQYELNATSWAIAKLIGGGLTTRKVTDPVEEPCLLGPSREEIMSRHSMNGAAWHQTTPALKLILCNRSNTSCNARFSLLHNSSIQAPKWLGPATALREVFRCLVSSATVQHARGQQAAGSNDE
jgi:hypothetical protein